MGAASTAQLNFGSAHWVWHFLSDYMPWSWGQEASPPAGRSWEPFSRAVGLGGWIPQASKPLELTAEAGREHQPALRSLRCMTAGALPAGSLRSLWVDARPPVRGHPAKQHGAWKQEVRPSGSAGPMGDWPTLLSDKAGTAGWGVRAGDPWAWSSGPGLARGQARPASQPCALNPSVPPGMRCAAGGA